MKKTNKVKSITSALVLGSALLFNACSSDMFDTEKKDTAYYLKKENQAETKKKAEWCLSFYGPGFKSVEDFLSDEVVAYFAGDPYLSDPNYASQYEKIGIYRDKLLDFLRKNGDKYDTYTNDINCGVAVLSQILIEDVKNLESEK